MFGWEFWINRDADAFSGEAVSDVAVAATGFGGVLEADLFIHGARVINLAADVAGLQVIFQGVALSGLGEAEGVLVPDVFVVRVGDGQDDFDGMGAGPEGIFLGGQTLAVSGISDDDTGQARELAGIGIGIGLAGGGIAGVVREFDSQQGGLKWIEAKVAPDLEVEVFGTAAVGAQEAGLISECVVLGDEHAAIAETAEVF